MADELLYTAIFYLIMDGSEIQRFGQIRAMSVLGHVIFERPKHLLQLISIYGKLKPSNRKIFIN